MSDQPTEKHEEGLAGHNPSCASVLNGKALRANSHKWCDCGLVHQPSAVQDMPCPCSEFRVPHGAKDHESMKHLPLEAQGKATARPWRASNCAIYGAGTPRRRQTSIAFAVRQHNTDPAIAPANAELIVLAVNNYEAQAVRIRELEGALSECMADNLRQQRAELQSEVVRLTAVEGRVRKLIERNQILEHQLAKCRGRRKPPTQNQETKAKEIIRGCQFRLEDKNASIKNILAEGSPWALVNIKKCVRRVAIALSERK